MPDGIRQLVQRFTTEFGNARPVGGRPAELAGCWRAGPLEVAYGPDPIPERSLGRCIYKQNLTMITSHANFLSDDEKRLILGANAARFARLSND